MLESNIATEFEEEFHLNRHKYGLVDYFFLTSEFIFGMATVQEKMESKAIGTGKGNFAENMRYWIPVSTLFCLYITDSHLGKILGLVVFTAGIDILQLIIVASAAANSLGNHTGDAYGLANTFLTDIHRPLRWAIMYSNKPSLPFAVMRRFIVLTEASYLFGKFIMGLLESIPAIRNSNDLDVILPGILIVEYSLYTFLLYALYRRQGFVTYFKRYAVDKATFDLGCFIIKNVGKKYSNLQSRLANRQVNKALCFGILLTLAVFLPFTIARFDNEIIKRFLKNNKDFLGMSDLKLGFGTIAPLITVMVFLTIECAVTPLLQFLKLHPYYIFWLTFSYLVILTSVVLMVYLYIELEAEMPFPTLPKGKAHLTVFNCLPGSIEIEWDETGKMTAIQNLDYKRILLMDPEIVEFNRTILVSNKATGMYMFANITLKEGRENFFVVNYEGITHANMSEPLAFDRYKNSKAQVRILDCFQKCCHGSITIAPKKIAKKNKKKQTNVTFDLTKNLLSKRIDIYSGTYNIIFNPSVNTSLMLKTLQVDRLDKLILLLNTMDSPTYKVWNMVSLTGNLDVYIPMAILDAIFRISHAYQKMIAVYLTERKIFAFMMGIHFMLTRVADFLSITFFYSNNLGQDLFFLVLGLSGFSFVIYLGVIVRFKKYFNPNIDLKGESNPVKRHRAGSKTSTATYETAGTTATMEPVSTSKVKNQ